MGEDAMRRRPRHVNWVGRHSDQQQRAIIPKGLGSDGRCWNLLGLRVNRRTQIFAIAIRHTHTNKYIHISLRSKKKEKKKKSSSLYKIWASCASCPETIRSLPHGKEMEGNEATSMYQADIARCNYNPIQLRAIAKTRATIAPIPNASRKWEAPKEN